MLIKRNLSLACIFILTSYPFYQITAEKKPIIIRGKLSQDLNACIKMVLSPKNKPMLFPDNNFLVSPKIHIASHFQNNVLIAKIKNQTVGMISFSSSKKEEETATINLLVVNENFQRQGIGTQLLCKALKKIKNLRTIIPVYNFNKKAINLYTKHGFIDTSNGGIGEDPNELLLILEHNNKKPYPTKKTPHHKP